MCVCSSIYAHVENRGWFRMIDRFSHLRQSLSLNLEPFGARLADQWAQSLTPTPKLQVHSCTFFKIWVLGLKAQILMLAGWTLHPLSHLLVFSAGGSFSGLMVYFFILVYFTVGGFCQEKALDPLQVKLHMSEPSRGCWELDLSPLQGAASAFNHWVIFSVPHSIICFSV